MSTPDEAPARAGLRTTLQTLVVGPVLLALGIRGLIEGPHSWPRTALWICGVVVGGGLLLVGVALLLARRGSGGRPR